MRNALAALIAVCALSALTPAAAQTVYKWKDARGVTHYSERPPASGKFTTQDAVRDPATSGAEGAAAAASPAAAATAAPVDTRCTSARNNLATLQGKNIVQIDSDNDGKADRTLSDADRVNQIELARSTLKAYNCSETAAG